ADVEARQQRDAQHLHGLAQAVVAQQQTLQRQQTQLATARTAEAAAQRLWQQTLGGRGEADWRADWQRLLGRGSALKDLQQLGERRQQLLEQIAQSQSAVAQRQGLQTAKQAELAALREQYRSVSQQVRDQEKLLEQERQ